MLLTLALYALGALVIVRLASVVIKREIRIMTSFETLSADVKALIAQSAEEKASNAVLTASINDLTAQWSKLRFLRLRRQTQS